MVLRRPLKARSNSGSLLPGLGDKTRNTKKQEGFINQSNINQSNSNQSSSNHSNIGADIIPRDNQIIIMTN